MHIMSNVCDLLWELNTKDTESILFIVLFLQMVQSKIPHDPVPILLLRPVTLILTATGKKRLVESLKKYKEQHIR